MSGAGCEACSRWRTVRGVDLWRVDLDPRDGGEARRQALLAPAERDRAARLGRPEVRRRFVNARAGLRCVLSGYAGAAPAALAFALGPHGKPALAGGPGFSLSHAEDLALVAVSPGPAVGVDLERVRPVPEAAEIARRWLDPGARAACGEGGDAAAFLRAWTRREAYLKALGVGLSEEGAPLPPDPARWAVEDLVPGEGFVGALVVALEGGAP